LLEPLAKDLISELEERKDSPVREAEAATRESAVPRYSSNGALIRSESRRGQSSPLPPCLKRQRALQL